MIQWIADLIDAIPLPAFAKSLQGRQQRQIFARQVIIETGFGCMTEI
jgi:hypothetical protein